ncbi:hypothetical protein BHM03_00021947 [Ensete ventricosum]|nr:hypothetical protein BHM03_00021947 [Ensete ventricosum]
MAFRRQSASPLPELRISASPLVFCPSCVSRPVPQSFARVAYLGQSTSPLPELRISASPLVFFPSCVFRSVPQSFARVAYLGQSLSPLPELRISASPPVLCPSRMDDHDNTSEEATLARGTKSVSDLESEVEVPEHDAAWPMPITVAWRPMPPPHAAAAARPPIAIPETAPGTHRLNSPSRTPEGVSIHRKFRPPPTLADLHTRTKTGQADTSA